MNNIYQVIWSQVKQCYVVTSELAKRRGKGCGARSLRVAAVSMGVTAALLSAWTGVGTSVAHAESVNVARDSKITISDNQSDVIYNLNGSNITFTVASGGNVHDISGSVNTSITLNKVFVYGTVNGRVFGGRAIGDGAVTENSVTVSGGAALINGEVYGGYADVGLKASGSATGNKVFIYGGTIKKGVYGGYSYSRDANENEVNIENGSVVSVTGGFSPARAAIKNRVTISGGTVTSTGVRAVVGGAGGSTGEDSVTQENEVIIKGNAKVDGSVIGGADTASSYAVNYAAVVNNNRVTIQDSAVISGSMYGGYGNLNVKDKTENKVFIKGGSVSGNVYGGYITNYIMGAVEEPAGNVKKNEIHITGGTVGTNDKTVIAGGYVDEYATGAAMDNAVTITGGTVKSRVFGGHVNNATSAATGNKLNISVADTSVADTVLERNAYGGYANGTGEVSKNYVTITGGTLNHHVYGGYSEGGAARNNKVDISGKNTNVGADVYGGYNNETDNAEFTVNNNTVKITDATIGGDVSGGEGDQNVFENRIEITGGKLGKMDDISIVMGGSAYDGNATKNEVEISGGTQLIGEVYGGYSSNSQTAENIVTIDNATVKKSGEYRGNVYGGCSDGDATGNRVTISGTETQVEGKVYGGYISKSSTAATGNTVEIKEGTIGKSEGDTVFGGYAKHGDSKQNNVIITGGTVNGSVVGGYANYGDSKQNNVSITGGTVNGDVIGGDAGTDAAGNTITLSNCTINGNVHGCWTMDGEKMNNTVNLTGKVSGLDGEYSVVSGSGFNNPANTGNELHIGGTKDGSITGVWQGMTGDVVTNKISSVWDFESIVYHSVKWDKDVAALEATTVDNVKTLDITNMKFYTDAEGTMQKTSFTEGESMALLKSNSILGASGVGIGLTYKDGSTEKTATSAELAMGVTLGGGATDKTEDTGVNGVKLTQSITEKVKLSEGEYAINYSCEVGEVKAVTFNASTPITFADGGIARDLTDSTFASSNTVDAVDLKFADTSETIAKGASMTLVANATGIATEVDNKTGKTIAIKDYEDAQKIKYSATATGDVSSDGTAVKFTVDSVTLGNVDLTGWTGTTSDLTTGDLSGWAGTGVAVATGDMINADLSDLNPGDTKPILTAGSGVTFTDDNISGNKKWQAGGTIDDTADTSGVTVAGTMIGGGVKVDDTNKNVLVYQKDAKTITGITLGSVAFTKDGTVRSFDNSYNLTGADFTTTGFSISNASTATMNTGDTMVVVDAANAIKGTGDATLKDFTATNVGVTFTDAIDGTVLTFTGTRADTLEQNAAKTQIIFKVGDKNVETATFNGSVTWSDTAAHYTNDATKYKFNGATNIDATNLIVTGTTDKALKSRDAMMLLSAENMTASITNDQSADNKTASKITVNFNDDTTIGIALGAEATGKVAVATNAVNYEVTGVEIQSVDLAGWKGTAVDVQSETDDWTVKSGASITTGELANAGLDAMNPGDVKTILTADTTADFSVASITGNKAWQAGGTITDTDTSGVSVTGTTTGGGVKVDDTNKNVLVYQKDAKTITGITLGSVAFTKDGTVRSFDNSYNLTVADFTTTGFSISNAATATMNAGDTMVVVDAVNAIKGTGDATLKDFATQNAGDAIAFTDQIDGKALTLSGTHQDTLEQNTDKKQILYKVGDKNVNKATFTGEVAWNDSEAYYTNDASKYKFNGATDIDVTALKVTGTSTKALKNGDAMMLLSAEGMTAGTVTPQSDANKTASKITVNYSDAASGITLAATATGAVSATANAVNYTVDEVTLKTVDLAGWNGTTASVPDNWSAPPNSVAVNNADAITVVPTTTQAIVNAGSSMFADVNVEKVVDFDPVTQNGVTLTGTQKNVIKTTQTNVPNDTITYEVGKKDVKTVDIGTVEWGGEALDGSGTEYNYAGASVDHSGFGISNPEQVEVNTAMTLLKANETLAEMAEETKKTSYAYSPVSGVRIDAEILGNLEASDNKVTFIATENKASKLTFTNVEWKDSGALLTRPANITFAGADVDTAKINFHNIQKLAANSRMTLVSDFGETVGTITGDTFTVGSGLQGEGAASLSGTDLIFTAKTAAESLTPTEATHETVMAMEAGTAVVAAGREYVDSAVEGLGLVSNMAPDGTSTFASMGGGVGRYKTGSHVDTHTWSAVVAVGSKRDHKKGNLEWGVFAEYGRGNYTLHDDNGGRGDGNTHYAGGGLLAKWTNKHDVYTEASFRMGRMSDSASNMLRDVLGNTYGYDVHANYFGGHVGLGKIYKVKGNKDLDVYGKFFYTRRNGVDFDAGGNHYSLDSVASKLLRIGARYGSNDRKWNWYGGLAYEYEFGGESKGTVDGLAIRSASIKGASVRGEIGVRLEATKTNPWKADISIYGYGGKHRGIGGTVSVAYMF